jgi:hypothetical protein
MRGFSFHKRELSFEKRELSFPKRGFSFGARDFSLAKREAPFLARGIVSGVGEELFPIAAQGFNVSSR